MKAVCNIVLEYKRGLIWTPVRTKPKREKKLAGYCAAHDVDFYLPFKRSIHRYARRSVEFLLPMFPGYVFCCLNEEKYQLVLRSNCVVYRINILEADEKLLLRELDAVRSLEKISASRDVIVKPEIAEGVRVCITNGPMAGQEGIIERRRGKALVTVNIDILGQSVSTELDIEDLSVD